MPFVWCTACLGVVLEQSEEANDIFEDIIDCLELPGWKELTEKVENELPGSESLMKQIVKESGYDFHKPPSKENMGIPFMRGLMKGGLRFVSGYSEKYIRWALKGKRRIKDYRLLVSKIDELVKVGFNSKNEREKGQALIQIPSFLLCLIEGICLTLIDSEHLCATTWAYSLGCWLTILHDYSLGILHFLLDTAFHTVCLH